QEIQKNLQETLNQLQEVRRRERDMIDVMGHELRTPITIVRNALLVMDSDYNNNKLPPDKLRKYLDMSIESVRREITLIETLLSATKVEGNRIQLTLKKVDLIDVVNDALEAHKKIAGNKNLAIDFVPPEQPVFVYADRVRTQEIMDNYVSNAIKYTVKGGVTIRISLENDIAKVAVTDTGVGISKEDLVNLGKKFFRAGKTFSRATTSTQPSGTGLGLFVAFELLRLMNGTKEIKSDMGKGSTFSFTLPLYKDQKETSMDQAFMKDNFVDGETEGESEL
ncbi:MAG TPA: HAMP domain-containing sensor histidine kinase, partial [Candidatus Dojkabacteria bacterium]|nr:HAMP domain-containing sensor histidine kinase [Candidatus Dojkabacteria bacterium]